MELVQEPIDHWNQELVFRRLGVEGAVVDAEAPGLVCLLDQQGRSKERRHARSDDPLGEHGRTLPLQLILL
jgi:hypothetical protein